MKVSYCGFSGGRCRSSGYAAVAAIIFACLLSASIVLWYRHETATWPPVPDQFGTKFETNSDQVWDASGTRFAHVWTIRAKEIDNLILLAANIAKKSLKSCEASNEKLKKRDNRKTYRITSGCESMGSVAAVLELAL